MALLFRELLNLHAYAIEHWSDPRVKDTFLLTSFWPIATINVIYVYVSLSLGPKLMEHYKPFKLKKVLMCYNILQMIYCLVLIVLASIYMIPYSNLLCEPIDTTSPRAPIYSNLTYAFFILKIIDLLDTVFFILKKNNHQITFLHVYHHMAMVFAGWVAVKFLPGGSGMYLGYINCCVHVVMYGYYFLSLVYDPSKILWLKRHITHLQLLQFCILTVIFSSAAIQPTCEYPRIISAVIVIQNLFMLCLFGDFYYKSYLKPRNKEKDDRKIM